jgi:metal-sulfur cluster biosynthetic enzyme
MTDADLLAALRDCYHPVLRRNVVDLNLIRSATITPEPNPDLPNLPQRYAAHINLTAPGSDEAANAQLVAQIENRLLGLELISRVSITLLPALFPIL